MELKFFIPQDKARKAKKQERAELLALLVMVIIGLLIIFAPTLDKLMDKLF